MALESAEPAGDNRGNWQAIQRPFGREGEAIATNASGSVPAGISLAAQLRRWRERALLTQEQLARCTGLGVRTIRRLESASEGRPRTQSVRLLADALRLTEAERAQLIAGMLATTAATAPSAIARQLPPDVTGFCGRADYLAELDRLLADRSGGPRAVVICVIAGTAGVGKTALAVRWGHRRTRSFPDGQLYANLRGFQPGGEPVDPSIVVCGFLEALGVSRQHIPADLDGQTAMYRSLLSGRRTLVVLDNASSAEQVRPLLPTTAGAMALVTSRNQLAGLAAAEGAHLLSLDLLSVVEAHQLLVRRLGNDRVAAEPDAIGDVISLCVRLPLALAVTAARASADPQLTMSAIVGELRDARSRLSALNTGDAATDVRAVFSSSYRRLSPPAARLFNLFGLHPGPEIGVAAAASLAGLPVAQARLLLDELVRAHLIAQHAPGRYTMHDLLRLYAADQAELQEPEQARREAMLRIVDHCLHSAHAADRLLYPARDPIRMDDPLPAVTVEVHDSPQQALRWFAEEHHTLLAVLDGAVARGLDRRAWQLAWAVAAFLELRGHWQECLATQTIALDAARRLGDVHLQAVAVRALGRLHTQLSRYDAAETALRQAIELAEQIGDPRAMAHSHLSLARLLALQKELRAAIDHAEQALNLFRAEGHHRGQAAALNALGWYRTCLGDHAAALVHCGQALALHEESGDSSGMAATLDSLAHAHHQLGDFALAESLLQRAVKLVRELGDRHLLAQILVHRGDTQLALGKREQARESWLAAHDLLGKLGHPDADLVQAKLQAAQG